MLRAPVRSWPCFAARAVLALLLGCAAFFFPFSQASEFATTFAAFSLFDALLVVAAGWRGGRGAGERWPVLMVSGIIGMLVSGLLLFPVFDIVYRVAVLGVVMAWAALTGTLHVIAAIRLRGDISSKRSLGLSGLISVALAIALPLFLLLKPGSPLLAASPIIGVYAIAVAINWAMLATALRKRL